MTKESDARASGDSPSRGYHGPPRTSEKGVKVALGSSNILVDALFAPRVRSVFRTLAKMVPESLATPSQLDRAAEKLKLGLLRPGQIPVRIGEEIVWRAPSGPRSHRLAVPNESATDAETAFRAKEDGSSCVVLLLGQPEVSEILGGVVMQRATTLDTLAQDLVDARPALLLIDGTVAASLSASEVRWAYEAAHAQGAVVALWVSESTILPLADKEPGFFPAGIFVLAGDLDMACAPGKKESGLTVLPVGPWLSFSTVSSKKAEPSALTLAVLDFSGSAPAAVARLEARLPAWKVQVLGPRKESSVPPDVLLALGNAEEAWTGAFRAFVETIGPHTGICVGPRTLASLPPPLSGLPVQVCADDDQLVRVVQGFERKPEYCQAAAHRTFRFARENLSARAALRRLSAHCGLPDWGERSKLVSVICVSNRPEMMRSFVETYRAQSYPHKELIMVANVDTFSANQLEELLSVGRDVTLLRTNAAYSLGESLNRARSVARGELWTKMDDDDFYGVNYLRDQILTMEASGATVVGKGTFYTYLKDEQRLLINPMTPELAPSDRFLHGGTILADRKAVEGIAFQPVVQGTDSLFLQECKLTGQRIYSGDRFNFAYIRYPDASHHTHGITNAQYTKNCVFIADNFDESLIVA